MENNTKFNWLMLLPLMTMALTNIYVIKYICSPDIVGWITQICFMVCLYFSFANNNKLLSFYIYLMLFAFLFQIVATDNSFKVALVEVAKWMSVICLMFVNNKKILKYIFTFAVTFYFAETITAIYERMSYTHVFEYDSDILNSFVLSDDGYLTQFRSFSLLGHPLNNANAVSAFMGLVIVAPNLNRLIKTAVIIIGVLALISFNCRGALLVWIIIFAYRLFLYEKKLSFIIPAAIVFYLVLPNIMLLFQNEAIGRLAEGFNDSSTEARLLSFTYYFYHNWTFNELMFGGVLLTLPGSDLLLENGVLLNLGYWGIPIGLLKLIMEIFISYKLLRNYCSQKDTFIALFAVFGVGMTNNNLFYPMILFFYTVAFLSFKYYIYNKGIDEHESAL